MWTEYEVSKEPSKLKDGMACYDSSAQLVDHVIHHLSASTNYLATHVMFIMKHWKYSTIIEVKSNESRPIMSK